MYIKKIKIKKSATGFSLSYGYGELHPPLSQLIGNKKFSQALRNCLMLHENQRIFLKWEISFHNRKMSGKPKFFQDGVRITLSIHLHGISKF